jgi:hypothetical protein
MSGYEQIHQASTAAAEADSVVHRTRTLARLRTTLIVLEVLLAVGAFGGAIALLSGVIDLGESTADLPFSSPVLAGLALGLINGVLPAVVAFGAWRREAWSELGHVVVGAALIGWIVVQVAFIGFGSALQATYLLYGVVVLALGTVRLALLQRPIERRGLTGNR